MKFLKQIYDKISELQPRRVLMALFKSSIVFIIFSVLGMLATNFFADVFAIACIAAGIGCIIFFFYNYSE